MHKTKVHRNQIVTIKEGVTDPVQEAVIAGAEYHIEGYWDDLTGKSWMFSDGNFAAMHYGLRVGMNALPVDDEVLYGKIGSLGHLVHVSEIAEFTD